MSEKIINNKSSKMEISDLDYSQSEASNPNHNLASENHSGSR